MRCVILAGGSGMRLWPLSTQSRPKQFLPLIGEDTMFLKTVERNTKYCESFSVMTNLEFKSLVEEEMDKACITNYSLLLEEVGRNTAPAIALACMQCPPDEIMFVVPADHDIQQNEEYEGAIFAAKELALQGQIVTFGIQPTFPNTNYGYIRYQGNAVIEFKEKPSLEVAKMYLDHGDYLWNSGMFMFRCDVFLQELEKYRKDIFTQCSALSKEETFLRGILSREAMLRVPSESVDYAVMEHSEKVKVVPSAFHWSDIGTLEALCETYCKDANGNTVSANTIFHNCTNVGVINGGKQQTIVLNDLHDVILVNTAEAIYLSVAGSSMDIKDILQDKGMHSL